MTFWQKLTGQGFARFNAGDLIGIVPEGSALTRRYVAPFGSRAGLVGIDGEPRAPQSMLALHDAAVAPSGDYRQCSAGPVPPPFYPSDT